MTTRSRAVVLQKFDQPLEIREYDVPKPREMSAVVRVRYAGVCGTDVHLQAGKLPVPTPVVLGHEAVGQISALGPGLTHDVLGNPLRPGDWVSWLNNIACGRCRFCLVEQQPTLCTGNRKVYGINQSADSWPHLSGGWSDYIYLQPGTVLVRIPEVATPQQVISLGCAGPTAVHGALNEVQVRFGDTVVVQGSGPVGLASAMYAHLAGAAKVIIVGGPTARLDLAKQLGVGHHHLDIFEITDAAERVQLVRQETSRNAGADVVIEATGVPSAVAEAIDYARPDAAISVVGQYTDHGTTPINPHLITRKNLNISGSWGFGARHYIGYIASLPKLLEHFDLGRLVTEYSLTEANSAIEDAKAGSVLKAVLRVGDE
ncbi:zinc-binding dehydrogenase [Saccharopolyspora sp. WRP15-2]|uniref:Zinc-binding dehydrogenase n=1 Tax=Saccharopolyspora oryzae TaxID=2997343 RepID=A0ABT4VB66_9PSEU|nr:zinc-binding dehydrogenase [Saccharopolyspora oryzae]MDA3630639.1 zinc-binding dehydrogenase [Saccharopolyspora oryzae]